MKIDWMWLLIGLALGYLVGPMIVGTLKGKTKKTA